MALLYKYTYLNANGYLDRFRQALNAPMLDRATLTKILKIFDSRHKYDFNHFIVAPEGGGPKCMYSKQILNMILGIDETGYQRVDPKFNTLLNEVKDIFGGIEEKEIMGERPAPKREYEPTDNSSPEENMDYVSAQLANLEEKKMKGKKITITESQFNELKQRLAEEHFVEPDKVKIVQKYLDDNFVRGSMPALGEDGYPKMIGVVGLKFKDGTVAKNMTATQLFYLLQDKFNKIYEDPKQRDAFLKKIVVDWYYKRINNGLLSRNNY